MGCGASSPDKPSPSKAPHTGQRNGGTAQQFNDSSPGYSSNKVKVSNGSKRTKETRQSKEYTKYEKKLSKNFADAVKLELKAWKDNPGAPISPERGVMIGYHNQEVKESVKVVRIFTSSTFTDTKQERNALMVKSYPVLKEFCREVGYDFQIVDMRWGIREDADDNHTATEICLNEVKECQKLSTGPNFVTFLSHKYGYKPIPRRIPAKELEEFTQDVNDEEREIFNKGFKKDENAIPAEYVLQPISVIYPDYKSSDKDVSRSAYFHWTDDIHDKCQDVLIRGAKKYGGEEAAHKYEMSVTEREIEVGILGEQSSEKAVLWFKRSFNDIESIEYSKKLSRYYEYGNEKERSRKMVSLLRDSKLPKKLPPDNIVSYEINWDTENGVNPDLEEHQRYLNQLCEDFTNNVKTCIQNAVNEQLRRHGTDTLIMEIMQHNVFRQAKVKQFHGRDSLLKSVENYFKDQTANNPFIITGDSGSGKTSVMAKIASKAWTWMGEKAVVIYRFIGTSQSSSSIRPLLDSINAQIMKVYAPSMTRNYSSLDLKSLKEEFLLYLSCIPSERPLLLLLDSLDQLDSADGGRQLDWLPKELPEGVRMALSTLPQEKYVTYPRCKAIYPENKWFVPVPGLTVDEVHRILSKWLKSSKRTLTPAQKQIVTQALEANPLPLFLKLCYDEAFTWHSYDPLEKTVIQSTVVEMINSLFDQVERSHGKILVMYALGYLTAAQTGLTEVEMEDLLSLNDDVLNDVYQYWTPPFRRLPPLLWVRIKNDLKEYIVSRGADGVQVINWYHRQFIETATQRYLCSNENLLKSLHLDLSNYFMGTWADKPKPYKDKRGRSGEEIRYVTKQPLMYNKDNYNIRKLNMLPYHLIQTKDVNLLKTEVLCNYEFLQAKLRGLGLRSVLGDLKSAQMQYPRDRDISVLLETLQLSSDALTHSPTELAGQLVGRIHGYGADTVAMVTQAKLMMSSGSVDDDTKANMGAILQMLEKLMNDMDENNKMLNMLLSQARESSIPVLVPHSGFLMPPGGQLLHKLSGHLEKINDICMNKDGNILATGSDDKTVKFWNVYTGETIKSVEVKSEVKFIKFLSNKKLAVSCTMGQIMIVNHLTGEIETHMDTDASSEYVARPMTLIQVKDTQQECIVALRNQYVDIFNAKTGKLEATFPDDLKQHKTKLWGEQKVLTSCQHFIVYSAFADDDFYLVPVEALNGVKVYKQNVFAEEAEWINLESKDHISNMAVAEAENQVIICNGKTRDFLFYDIVTRQQLFVMKNSAESVNHLDYSLKDHSVYYTADNEVGQVKMGDKDLSLNFRHPCKVMKVVSQDGRCVATIAEDNILRVWDRVMEPFSADLSGFTGQVHVRSEGAGNMIQSMIGEMGGDLGDIDVNSALTTKDIKNYWTRNPTVASKDNVYTTFHPFPNNPRYIMVTQSHHEDATVIYWTRCITIWDISTMKCIRRLFLPEHKSGAFGAIYVHGIVQDHTAVIHEYDFDIEYKLLNLQTWKVEELQLHHTAKKIWGSQFKYLPQKKVFLVETSYDQLTVFDLSQRQSVGYLSIRKGTFDWHLQQIGLSFPYRTNAMTCHKFDEIKVSEDESRVVTAWGHSVVTVWDTNTWGVLHELKVKDAFASLNPKENIISLSEVCDNQHIVVNANVPAPKDKYNSTCVLSLIGGNVKDYTQTSANIKEIQSIQVSNMEVVLQQLTDQEHVLQWIGVGKEGQSVVLDKKSVGPYANELMSCTDEQRCVTWCTSPLDKTIKLFGIIDGTVEQIVAFTPDERVNHVALVDNGDSILINTSSGLVKLQLSGKGIEKKETSDIDTADILFNDIDLDVKMDLSARDSL